MTTGTPEQDYRAFWERYGAVTLLCLLALLPIAALVIYEAVKLGVVDAVLMLQEMQKVK